MDVRYQIVDTRGNRYTYSVSVAIPRSLGGRFPLAPRETAISTLCTHMSSGSSTHTSSGSSIPLYTLRRVAHFAQSMPKAPTMSTVHQDYGDCAVDITQDRAAAPSTTPGVHASGSVGVHHAAQLATDAVLGLVSYNLGIQNTEAPKLLLMVEKYNKLEADIGKTFNSTEGINIMLLSEFGNMYKNIDACFQERKSEITSTKDLFKKILRDLDLEHIKVFANAPYIALIDSRVWSVNTCELVYRMCSNPNICAQHLIVQHVDTHHLPLAARQCRTLRLWNSHIPSTGSTTARKEECVRHMLGTCVTSPHGSGGNTPMPWAILGDLNVDAGTLGMWCQPFIQPGSPCFSFSHWPAEAKHEAQKSDLAVSQGIQLIKVQSFIGWHSQPCASDVHDSVVVLGALTVAFCGRNWQPVQSSGDVHPTANISEPAPHIFSRLASQLHRMASHLHGNPAAPHVTDTYMAALRVAPQNVMSRPASNGDAHPIADQHSSICTTFRTTQSSTPNVDNNRTPNVDSSAVHTTPTATPAATPPHATSPATPPASLAHSDDTPTASLPHTGHPLSDCDADSEDIPPASLSHTGHPRPDLGECINGLADVATGSVWSADWRRQTDRQLAAQKLMKTFFISGNSIRSPEEVLHGMKEPIQQRDRYVALRASLMDCSVSQPATGGRRGYTEADWISWFASNPLSETEMKEVVWTWKHDFLMNQHTAVHIEELLAEDTRSSKAKARDLRNGAFKAFLNQQCNHKRQLAMMFLRHPADQVDAILESWAAYMTDPAYEQEKQRSRKVDAADEQAVAEKQQQVELTLQVHRARHQLRQMYALDKRMRISEDAHHAAPKMTTTQRIALAKFRSGDLVYGLNELTQRHGYGMKHGMGDDPILLGPRMITKHHQERIG